MARYGAGFGVLTLAFLAIFSMVAISNEFQNKLIELRLYGDGTVHQISVNGSHAKSVSRTRPAQMKAMQATINHSVEIKGLNKIHELNKLSGNKRQCRNSTEFLKAHCFGLPDKPIRCGSHTTYLAPEACEIASSYSQILLFGESLCRHVAMALMSILRGNLRTGATREWAVPRKVNCSGQMQYSEQGCRSYSLVNSFRLAESDNATRAFCPGRRVYTRFLEWWQVHDVKAYFRTASKSDYLRLDRIEPHSVIAIYPPGLHADMRNPGHMLRNYVQPIVDAAQRVPGTVAVIIGVHSMGPNMPREYAGRQCEAVIVPFNYALRQYAEARGIGYLDTYNLTKGLFTSDGMHYGAEANLLKAQLLLNYLDIYRMENPGIYNVSGHTTRNGISAGAA